MSRERSKCINAANRQNRTGISQPERVLGPANGPCLFPTDERLVRRKPNRRVELKRNRRRKEQLLPEHTKFPYLPSSSILVQLNPPTLAVQCSRCARRQVHPINPVSYRAPCERGTLSYNMVGRKTPCSRTKCYDLIKVWLFSYKTRPSFPRKGDDERQ